MNAKFKTSLLLSIAIIIVGIALALTGMSFTFEGPAKYVVELSQIWLCMLAGVVFALLFGFVRYDRVHALALSASVLHDYLMSFAIISIVSLILPGITQIPAANAVPFILVSTIAFTLAQALPVINKAAQLYRSTSRREMPVDDIVVNSVKESRNIRLSILVVELIFLVALLFGGKGMIAVIIPIIVIALVSFYSAENLASHFWALAISKLRPKKQSR